MYTDAFDYATNKCEINLETVVCVIYNNIIRADVRTYIQRRSYINTVVPGSPFCRVDLSNFQKFLRCSPRLTRAEAM